MFDLIQIDEKNYMACIQWKRLVWSLELGRLCTCSGFSFVVKEAVGGGVIAFGARFIHGGIIISSPPIKNHPFTQIKAIAFLSFITPHVISPNDGFLPIIWDFVIIVVDFTTFSFEFAHSHRIFDLNQFIIVVLVNENLFIVGNFVESGLRYYWNLDHCCLVFHL